MKKEKVLGEKVFYLTKLNLQGKIALPVTLEPGSELTVRTHREFLSCVVLQFASKLWDSTLTVNLESKAQFSYVLVSIFSGLVFLYIC